MLPDQTLPAVNTNQDIEQVCNNLPPKELNDFLLEQLFYTRKQLYCLDGNLYVRNGYHIEPVSDSKLDSLVLSVLDDKFRLIGKRSRVKSVADLIRLRDPNDFINISPDNKIIACKNGVFDAETFWFYEDSNPLALYFDASKICSKYELDMEMNPEWFCQSFRSKNINCTEVMYNAPLGPNTYAITCLFPNFCHLYNKNIESETYEQSPDGNAAWIYNIEITFLTSICDYILNLPTPVADQFFSDIANGIPNIVERIYQMIGYILVPGNEAKAYFLLQGESNSGKSILGKFLEGYFPPELVTSLDISRLGGQYLPDALSTSCLNLSMDLPNGKMSAKSVAVLKMLTGDDIITHEVKYKDAKPYRNKCKFVFSTNFPLDMQIYDQAFLNRTVCIPFSKSVPYERQDPKLLDKLNAERPYIIISNTQKIIVKKKRKDVPPGQMLFDTSGLLSVVYGGDDSDDAWDDTTLMDNQRFKKLCRLPQLGVYVDEAHHLFGADLEKQIRAGGANKTSLRDTINLLASNTSIVACYNYTGTPYVKNQPLPEVVYSYGLRESIWGGYLKDADPIGYENVKSEEFLRDAVKKFWERYGGNTYEELNPKLAIYAASIEEAVSEVKPALENILSELGIPLTKILLNVGDAKYTKNDDIRNFNNLDVKESEGNDKQFIILVEKGKEGWNCRSLFGVALFRNPSSKIFVLQATMRCLRSITDEGHTATIFLSKENFDILDDELHKNFNMTINDLKEPSNAERRRVQVHVMPPQRSIKLKHVWHEYSLHGKEYTEPLDFKLAETDFSKYTSKIYERESIAADTTVKEKNADDIRNDVRYSKLTLIGEISRYLNISCITVSRILDESVDGTEYILETVNKYNAVLDDIIIPSIFHALFEVTSEIKSEERELILLKEPKNAGYYEFSAKEDLILTNKYLGFTPEQIGKSFHADVYCFDSVPEKECFRQYITSNKVKEIYFTGMFTSNQGDLLVHYYDPESGRIRQYYPDFLAKMSDDSYQLIEVKGDNKIDDSIVKAKQQAAEEMATASGIKYLMYPGSIFTSKNVLEENT